MHILGQALIALFLIGAAGCLLVIPLTAAQLIRAALEKDTEEELRGATPRPESLGSRP